MRPLIPLALELLSGLDEEALCFADEHLAKIQAEIQRLPESEVATAIEDCMRIAYVLQHQQNAPSAAASVEQMCHRALSMGNEQHGRLDRVSEKQARIGSAHRSFEGTVRSLGPTEAQSKPKLTARDLRPDLILRRI